MTYTHRSIVLVLMTVIMLGYGALYALTLYSVHHNGFSSEYFIIGSTGGDGFQYVSLAHTLLESGRFAMDSTAPPNDFRTPVYPLFIAGILALTHTIVFIPIAQIILVACSAAIIFLLGARFFTRRIGLLAAILFAIDPYLSMVMFVSASDTLFVFVLLLSIYVLTMPERLGLGRAFCGGILMGILALVRPIGLYIFPLIILWLLWEGRKNLKQVLKVVVLFLAGLCLMVLPWMARNYAYSGHMAVSSIGVYNLLFYNLVTFEHERTGATKDAIHSDILRQIGATESDDLSSLTFTTKESAVASTYLLAHPFAYAAFHLYSMIPFYIGSSIDAATSAVYGRGVLQGTQPFDINISSLILHGHFREALAALYDSMPVLFERFLWLILCIASFGTVLSALYQRTKNVSIIMLFFGLIIAFGVLTGPVAYARYRLPAEPFLLILGIAGIMSAVRYIKGMWYNRLHYA